jgi:DNA-binding NtrC family response regulator
VRRPGPRPAGRQAARTAPTSRRPACARSSPPPILQPRFLESLRLALEDAHLVETRAKADDALELLRADPQRFDIVLCDLAMPGMDGVTFYDRMLELGVGDRFILMTGGAFTARASEFIRSGACPSISKPFMLERLLALLDEVTQARRAS